MLYGKLAIKFYDVDVFRTVQYTHRQHHNMTTPPSIHLRALFFPSPLPHLFCTSIGYLKYRKQFAAACKQITEPYRTVLLRSESLVLFYRCASIEFRFDEVITITIIIIMPLGSMKIRSSQVKAMMRIGKSIAHI